MLYQYLINIIEKKNIILQILYKIRTISYKSKERKGKHLTKIKIFVLDDAKHKISVVIKGKKINILFCSYYLSV